MLKRFSLAWALVVVIVALMLPASALAGGSVSYTVLRNSCTNSGGAFDYGKSIIRVRQDEYGKSGVARFRQRAWAQYKYGSSWQTVHTWNWLYSDKFGNTSDSWYFIGKFVYNWGSLHASHRARIKWRGEWLGRTGNVLYFQVIKGTAC